LRYWLAEIAGREVKPRTAANYDSTVRNHLVPLVGHIPLVDLTAADVRGVVSAVLDQGRSSTTALHTYRVLAIALAAAHREGYTYRDAAKQVRPPRKARPNLAVLAAAHARIIIDASHGDRLGSRWAAALLTGARQGELLGLELDRVGDSLDLSWQLQRLTWAHGCGDRCGWARGTDCPDRRMVAPPGFESRHLTADASEVSGGMATSPARRFAPNRHRQEARGIGWREQPAQFVVDGIRHQGSTYRPLR
jgi:hypothetical protein